MRKFIITFIIVLCSIVLFDFAYYRWGFYIPSNQNVEIISYTNGTKLFMKNDASYDSITVKGVNIGGSIPGKYVTDYAITYDMYYSWLELINEMGSNTIRLNTIFNDDFYNALYDYNKNHDQKLYLIQGINLDSYALNSHYDGYHKNFYDELITQAENAVDVIHGRKKLTLSKHGKGSYKKDISPYVLGFVVGSEWVDDTILYTNKKYPDKTNFDGNYIKTKDGATAFETMLARVMDHMLTYETKKYHNIRSISFVNSPETDPVTPIPTVKIDEEQEISYLDPPTLQYQYHKIVDLDLEHLENKEGYNGLFAAYNVSSYYPGYLNYEKIKYEDSYYSYLLKLTNHHHVPTLITEFGYSTSRGISTDTNDSYGPLGGMTEEEQGETLIKAYKSILKSGSIGGVIATWQDEWDKRSWNTLEKVDTTKAIFWGDVQTANQGLGILSFDPGKEKSICYVDGVVTEWLEKDQVLDNEDFSLSMKYDEKYVYFYVKNKKLVNTPIYIPIDTTKKSGTTSSWEYNLSFDRNVDFLIALDGTKGKFLVQEYYNVLEAVDGYELYNRNSYVNKPMKNSNKFELVKLLVAPYGTSEHSRNYKKAALVNTGILHYGNSNPDAIDYNSQSDFYSKNGNIEIRIPWQMLNFSNPSEMEIHDDYYENYGVDSYPISEIFVSVLTTGKANLSSYKLKPWGKEITYHERLKKSYQIIQKEWRAM